MEGLEASVEDVETPMEASTEGWKVVEASNFHGSKSSMETSMEASTTFHPSIEAPTLPFHGSSHASTEASMDASMLEIHAQTLTLIYPLPVQLRALVPFFFSPYPTLPNPIQSNLSQL